jgi:hypothetical protein
MKIIAHSVLKVLSSLTLNLLQRELYFLVYFLINLVNDV